jgi:ATP-dependent Lon protease
MKESAQAALSYLRSKAESLGISSNFLERTDLHIHFPAGAVPKDGPSAGIAVTLAIASVLSRRAVRRDVAMTGEVTLRGKALEIGGVKEKVLAAYRAGLREVVLPRSNEKDLRDVPDEVRANMAFSFVVTMDDVFRIALLPAAAIAPEPSAGLADHPPVEDASRAADGAPHSVPATNGGVRGPVSPLLPAESSGPADTRR